VENNKPHRKKLVGVVVSDAMEKSVVVKVERRIPHKQFKKIVKVSKKYHAHDEKNQYKVGDEVRIIECRPLSKTKNWYVDNSYNVEA